MRDSYTILEFPAVKTWEQTLFSPSMIYLSSGTLFERLHSLVAHSINGNDVTDGLNQAIMQAAMDNGFSEKEGAILYQYGHQRYANGGFYVDSILSHAVFMAVAGAVYRVVNLATISAQNRIAETNWRKQTKIAAAAAVSISSYAFMGYLGYTSTELFSAEMVRVCAAYLLPYVLGNALREIDVLSPTRHFSFGNYLVRNSLYGLRNLSTTLGLDYAVPFFLFGSKIMFDVIEKSSYATANAGIYMKRVLGTDAYTMEHTIDRAARASKYLPDEVGFTLGKIFVDMSILLFARFGMIADIRDPFKGLFTPAKPDRVVGRRIGVVARRRRGAARAERERKEARDKRVDRARIIQEERPGGATTSSSADVYYQHRAADIYKRSSNKRPKKQARTAENNHKTRPLHEIDALDLRTRFYVPTAPKHMMVPLSGRSISGNVWGVIANTNLPNHFKLFERSLESGVIRQSGTSGMKYLGKGGKSDMPVFEIKCSQDARLLGYYVQGETHLYNALKGVFGMDAAQKMCDRVFEQGEGPAIICFSKYVAKHNGISSAVQSM